LQLEGDAGERFFPGGGLQITARAAHQRRGEPIAVAERAGGGESLDAELSLVDGEGGISGDGERRAEPHAALEGAVRAVRRRAAAIGIGRRERASDHGDRRAIMHAAMRCNGSATAPRAAMGGEPAPVPIARTTNS